MHIHDDAPAPAGIESVSIRTAMRNSYGTGGRYLEELSRAFRRRYTLRMHKRNNGQKPAHKHKRRTERRFRNHIRMEALR